MDDYGNIDKDEVVAAVVAACAAGISSMMTWYFITEHIEDDETADQFMSEDEEEADFGDIEDGMEASSEQTKARPASSSQNMQPEKENSASNMIAATISAMAVNLGRIAKMLEQSSNVVNTDNLYDEVVKVQGFDEDFLIEAFEYVCSDEKRPGHSYR